MVGFKKKPFTYLFGVNIKINGIFRFGIKKKLIVHIMSVTASLEKE